MLNNKNLQVYKDLGFDKVEGWCEEQLFEMVDLLDNVSINNEGGCLEIGVHHGKFYLLLNSVINESYDSFAIDVFDDQNLNIDKSGKGDLEAFKHNLANFDVHKGANTKIITGDSTDQKIIKIFDDKVGASRFLSIDGGHTVEHTVSDLILANKLVANEGVVILDDILNYHWLGVIEGAFSFLRSKPTLVPFAIGFNKLFMCKLSYQEYYLDAFKASPFCGKVVDFSGYTVVALHAF